MIARKLRPKEQIKLTNQSLVFEVFADDEKLTIGEITDRVNARMKALGVDKTVSEQTVRRAVKALEATGQLRSFGRSGNAATFGRLSVNVSDPENQALVSLGGEPITIEEFVRVMTDPDTRPLKRKVALLSEAKQHAIRRMMVYTILSADQTGQDEALKQAAANLHTILDELAFIQNVVEMFVNSAVWYPQYRDRIGLAIRKLQQKDPDLYKLAIDYVRSEQ